MSSLFLKAGSVPVAACLAIADDAQSVNAAEYKHVQAAKLVHRMAPGTHKQWDQPTLTVRADRTPVTCMLELYVYPRSHGRMLRHIGNDIHEVVKLLMGDRLHGWTAGICK